jgi:hypothetical protein
MHICKKCNSIIEWANDMGIWYAYTLSHLSRPPMPSPVFCTDGLMHEKVAV